MFPKIKFTIFIFASGIIIVASIFICFHTQRLYAFWLNHNLEKVIVFINPNDSELFLEIGNGYFGHGKIYSIRKAEVAFKRAIKLRPDLLEAHYQLGRIHFINGKFESALFEINKVLQLDSEYKRAYYMYGLINGYKEDLDQAIWGFEEFIKRDDSNWAGYNDLAWIYFKKGDYQKVKEVAGKGLEKSPYNSWLNNIYGTALMNLGEKEVAQKSFERAFEEAEKLTPEMWGLSYPGNNPKIYATGLEETKSVIRHNLELVKQK